METQHPGDIEQAASTTRPTQTRLPATRPVEEPKKASGRVANDGVKKPRNYTRAAMACVRCKKNKLKCDDDPRGCGRCRIAGEVCCDIDPHSKGRVLERAAADDLAELVNRQRRQTELLEKHNELLVKQVKDLGATPVGMPE
ncbi:hypothetical protein V8C42DRAFT_311834 [Trichoderma barbatum]